MTLKELEELFAELSEEFGEERVLEALTIYEKQLEKEMTQEGSY